MSEPGIVVGNYSLTASSGCDWMLESGGKTWLLHEAKDYYRLLTLLEEESYRDLEILRQSSFPVWKIFAAAMMVGMQGWIELAINRAHFLSVVELTHLVPYTSKLENDRQYSQKCRHALRKLRLQAQ